MYVIHTNRPSVYLSHVSDSTTEKEEVIWTMDVFRAGETRQFSKKAFVINKVNKIHKNEPVAAIKWM